MKSHFVNSGTYVVSTKKSESLEAYVGSCVGVTLCDRKAGVGGLFHVLLPEPPSQDPAWHPEVSATAGMPIFIRALCELGAKKERLVACIAGGALIDPVSRADLVLDIGGRTADAVELILQNEKIPVLKSEIGGYFSWCINLDLKTWETSIVPALIPKAPALIPKGPALLPKRSCPSPEKSCPDPKRLCKSGAGFHPSCAGRF